VVERYRQAALVETFIAGREFNVSLWGDPPQVLPLAEIDFSAFEDPYERIVSFAAKWEEASFEYSHTPVICPAPTGYGLANRIANTALRAWDAIGCQGYARVDMRLADGDLPHVVEVNCNPDLSPEAGFHRAAHAAGYRYEEMVEHIVEIARRQYGAYDPFDERRVPADPRVIAAQGALTALSSRGEQRIVEDSGHHVHLDAPEAVITAVIDVVRMVR